MVTSSITLSKSLLRIPPLAYGIAQYAQKALQPSWILTKALVWVKNLLIYISSKLIFLISVTLIIFWLVFLNSSINSTIFDLYLLPIIISASISFGFSCEKQPITIRIASLWLALVVWINLRSFLSASLVTVQVLIM